MDDEVLAAFRTERAGAEAGRPSVLPPGVPPPNEQQQQQRRQQQAAAAVAARRIHLQQTRRKTRAIDFPKISEPVSVIDARLGRIHPATMNKDGHHTQVHLHRARDADLLEQFCRDKLPSDDIYVPAQHQPVNPEDEDDVVPDQHAAFGIQRATQARREPAWRDFGLAELMARGPDAGVWKGVGRGGAGGAAGGKMGPSGLPR